ncbi:MAG: HEPN domain-containing protein [Bacillota bacterium]
METLRDISIRDYNIALREYNLKCKEDHVLNNCAYHLQQSLEKYLKYKLELLGVDVPKKHNISILINLIKSNGSEISNSEQLNNFIYLMADTFTIWEAGTRYLKNFRVDEDKVKLAIEALPKLLELGESYEVDFYRKRVQSLANYGIAPEHISENLEIPIELVNKILGVNIR